MASLHSDSAKTTHWRYAGDRTSASARLGVFQGEVVNASAGPFPAMR
jgi:hypothetical protein